MTTTFRRFLLSFLPLLALAPAACDRDSASKDEAKAEKGAEQGDDASSKKGTKAKAEPAAKAEEKYAFSVKIGDAAPFTEAEGRAKVAPWPKNLPTKPKPAFDLNARKGRAPWVRVEFREMELSKGDNEVFRMNVSFSTTIDGKEQLVGCGGNEGTPDGLQMNITALDDKHLTGTLSGRLTSCHDSDTAKKIDFPGIDVEASFTDVPYLP